jgi:hypothetical protein
MTRRDRDDALQTISAMCISLARRVAMLEQRPALEYKGVWQSDVAYSTGAVVTRSGSMWTALISSRGLAPGQGNAGWQLCVKGAPRR